MRKSYKNEFDTDDEEIFLEESDESIKESFRHFQSEQIVNMLMDQEEESKSSYETSHESPCEKDVSISDFIMGAEKEMNESKEENESLCVKRSNSCRDLPEKDQKERRGKGLIKSEGSVDGKKKRLRNFFSHRDYFCECGKAYASYPALYLHIRQKHPHVHPSMKNLKRLASPQQISQQVR